MRVWCFQLVDSVSVLKTRSSRSGKHTSDGVLCVNNVQSFYIWQIYVITKVLRKLTVGTSSL